MSGTKNTPGAKPALITPRGAMKLIALVGMFGLATCSQPDGRALDELVREGGLYFNPETMEPYSGVAFATFQGQPGAVAQRLNLWNGTYHGPFESYFHDRSLSAKESYLNGVLHGPFEWFFESGELFEEGTYVDGRREGPYRAFWEDGAEPQGKQRHHQIELHLP